MKKLIFIFILLKAISVTSQGKYYVLNPLGTELYESPSLNSEIIGYIGVGKRIIAEKVLKSSESKVIGNSLSLKGDFIKIKNKNHEGYIFSSDLTKIEPKLNEISKGILIADILGKEINKVIEEKINRYGDVEYNVTEEITEYENGILVESSSIYCLNIIYTLRNLSFNEAYYQIILASLIIDDNKNKILFPKFHKKDNNEYLFLEQGATGDLKIIDHKNGTYTLSSNICT